MSNAKTSVVLDEKRPQEVVQARQVRTVRVEALNIGNVPAVVKDARTHKQVGEFRHH